MSGKQVIATLFTYLFLAVVLASPLREEGRKWWEIALAPFALVLVLGFAMSPVLVWVWANR